MGIGGMELVHNQGSHRSTQCQIAPFCPPYNSPLAIYGVKPVTHLRFHLSFLFPGLQKASYGLDNRLCASSPMSLVTHAFSGGY